MALPGDILTSLALPVLAAAGTAWAGVKFFAEKGVGHLFDQRLETLKAELARERETGKAQLDDALKRATELTLGDAAAERSYRFEARKRLYGAIGPLRFQLIQAAILYRDRMLSFARHPYEISRKSYYGQSTIYRLGRLIVLTEQIEQQIAIHDFSVDVDMLRLVRFRTALFDALSDGSAAAGHPNVDWTAQREHLYRDTIQVLGTSMLMKEVPPRMVRFDEFRDFLVKFEAYMEPLTSQMEQLDATKTPVLWLRLCAVAALCDGLVADDPVAEALGAKPADLGVLLSASRDAWLVANTPAAQAMLMRYRAEARGSSPGA